MLTYSGADIESCLGFFWAGRFSWVAESNCRSVQQTQLFNRPVPLCKGLTQQTVESCQIVGLGRYRVILNQEALGKSIIAFISAKHIGVLDTEATDGLINLADKPAILEIHSIAGEDCFLIKVRTSDMKSLNTIVNELKEPPLQMTTKTTIVLETYFEKVGGTTLLPELSN